MSALKHISSLSRAATKASTSTSSAPSRRHLSSSISRHLPSFGFFQRPTQITQPVANNTAVTEGTTRSPPVAMPHTPPNVPEKQSPNYPTTWSETQNPRDMAMRGPRFEQMNMEFQPQPLSAMEMVQREPIRLSHKRVTSCDGGEEKRQGRSEAETEGLKLT